MNRAMMLFKIFFIKIIDFYGTAGGPSKIRLLQSYEALWINFIDAILQFGPKACSSVDVAVNSTLSFTR